MPAGIYDHTKRLTEDEKKEINRVKGALYRLRHPDRIKVSGKKYYQANKDVILLKVAKWQKENPDQVKIISARKWKNHGEERKPRMYAVAKVYRKTPLGKAADQRGHASRRLFSCVLLNPWFKGCHGHHIDWTYVICIPWKLHRSIFHSVKKDINMKQINSIAWNYLQSTCPAYLKMFDKLPLDARKSSTVVNLINMMAQLQGKSVI